MTSPARPALGIAELDAMIEAATVDCYNEADQVTGLFAMIEERLALPFTTVVLGVSVDVEQVALTDHDLIVAICSRGGHRQAIAIVDVPVPTPRPAGGEWIDAYRRWLG